MFSRGLLHLLYSSFEILFALLYLVMNLINGSIVGMEGKVGEQLFSCSGQYERNITEYLLC